MHNFSFYSENLKLDATLFYPTEKKNKYPAVLFVHGWTSSRERSFQYAKALSDLGYICLLFDMRGHGTSDGDIKTFTIKEFFSDVVAAYDYLSTMDGVDKKNITAIGSSFGGYLAALLSAKRDVKNLVLRVPADYPNERFDKSKALFTSGDNSYRAEAMEWRKKAKTPTETYALEALHNFEGNVLIIESEKDEVIPHQTIVNYLIAVKNQNKVTHKVLKDAPHSTRGGKFRNEVEKILVEWFKRVEK